MQRVFLIFAVAFIALMAGVLFYAAHLPIKASRTNAAAPGTTADTVTVDEAVYPEFTLVDLDGKSRSFDEWSGKHRLVNFWATWCAPCRREIPLLKAFQEEHEQSGFQIIGMAVDFPEEVARYAVETDFNYPILIGQEDAMAVAETSGIEFIGMPFTMIVAADGELLNAHLGEIVAGDLEHIVKVLNMLDAGEIDRQAARQALNFL
jgi:thiol-disulfide isomerase/thioredoxin